MHCITLWSRDSIVGVVNRLRTRRFWAGFLTEAKDFSLLKNVETASRGDSASCSVGSMGLRMRRSAPLWLHDVDRHKFTFFSNSSVPRKK